MAQGERIAIHSASRGAGHLTAAATTVSLTSVHGFVGHAKLEQKNRKLNLHCEARTKSSIEEDTLVTHPQN